MTSRRGTQGPQGSPVPRYDTQSGGAGGLVRVAGRCAGLTASAASAPATDKHAAAASAGRYPLVTAAGLARLPRELKMAVATSCRVR
jgi:hypothetical protein